MLPLSKNPAPATGDASSRKAGRWPFDGGAGAGAFHKPATSKGGCLDC